MLSKVSKYVITIFSSFILALAVVIVLLFIRLQQGPLSIAFLSPYIQEAIQLNSDLNLDITIEDCVIKWRSFEKGFDISLIGANLKKANEVNEVNEDIIAFIPEMFIEFKIEKIIQLKLQIKSLELVSPTFTLERTKTGKFDFGIGNYEQNDEFAKVFNQLFFKNLIKENIPELEQIKILNADFMFIDSLTNNKWESRDTDLIINKNDKGIESVLNSEINVKNQIIPLKISSFYNFESEIFDIGINFSNLTTKLITTLYSKSEPLNRIESPLEGGLSFKLNETGIIDKISFNISSIKEGEIDLSPLIQNNIFINFLRASGEINIKENQVFFNDLYLSSNDAKFEANGSISDLDGATINLIGKIRDWANDDLQRLWPENILPPVRGWYLTRVKSGKITSGDVKINLSSGQIKRKELNDESIVAKLEISDVSINFLSSFPSLVKSEGRVEINPKKFKGFLDKGQVSKVPVSEGKIEINLIAPKKWVADLEFVAKGKNKEIFSILDNEPISVSKKFLIASGNVDGSSASRIILNFPVRLDLSFDKLNYAAVTNIENFAIKGVVDGIDLSNGNMLLNLTNSGLKIKGRGDLNKIPANIYWNQSFDSNDGVDLKVDGIISSESIKSLGYNISDFINGEIAFNLIGKVIDNQFNNANISMDLSKSSIDIDYIDYTKDINKLAKLKLLYKKNMDNSIILDNIEYNSKNLKLDGNIEFDNSFKIKRIDINKFITPLNDISLSVRKKRPKGYLIAVNGNNLNVEPYVKKFLNSKLNYQFPEMKLFLQIKKMQFTETKFLIDSKNELIYDGNEIIFLKSTGKLNDNSHIIAKIITKNKKNKYFMIHSKDAGSIAKSTGLFEDAKGGNLLLYAKINDGEVGPLFDGKIILENIRLIKVPILARILSLASLTGIFEVFSGEGILFVKGDIPFDYDSGILSLKDARLYGPSLGMRINGSVDNLREKINIKGTIIPAYTINSILGQIPLLGSLLIGQKKEGVFAISYEINGDKESPYVGINPILSLSPGFIRDFFSVFKSGPSTPTLEELEIGGLPD